MVLLQHRLEPRARLKVVHRQAVEGVTGAAGEAQGVVEAEIGLGGGEALSVAQVGGAQLDPGALVLHQRAPFGREALEIVEAEGDPPDHQLPRPAELLPEAETPGAGGQLGHDRQAEATGQAAAEAGGQHHSHPHIAQLGGGGAHQHEGLGGGELHGLRRGGVEAPLDRLEHLQGAAQALQQQQARLTHAHLPHLEGGVAGAPNSARRQPQAGFRLGLEGEAQLPELLLRRRGEQFQAGPRRRHPARHRLAPVVGGDLQAFDRLAIESDAAIAGAQGPLPGGQQWIEAGGRWLEAGPQLACQQGLQQTRHPQPTAAGAAAGHGLLAWRSGSDGAGGHLGQPDRHLLQPVAVAFAVEQGPPAGLALLHQGQPAAAGDQAQGPALQVAPPAQFIGQVEMVAGEGQAAQPFARRARLQGPALHMPGPPLGLLGDRFAGLQGQAAPGGVGDLALAPHRLGAARQGEHRFGGTEVVGPEVVVIEPAADRIEVEGERVFGHLKAGLHRRSHPPGIRPEQQAATGPFGGIEPSGVQQAHRGLIGPGNGRAAGSWPQGGQQGGRQAPDAVEQQGAAD